MQLKKRGKVNIYPPALSLPKIPRGASSNEAIQINSQRGGAVKEYLGSFYTQLMANLLCDRVTVNNPRYVSPSPLFGTTENGDESAYAPDIIAEDKSFQMEVKAGNYQSGRLFFRAGQYAGYSWDFLNNSSMALYTAVFLFGDSRVKGHKKVRTEDGETRIRPQRSERLYICKNRPSQPCTNLHCCNGERGLHVIERLCESTRNLAILPHNFMSYLFALSQQEGLGKSSVSRSRRTRQTGYFRPKASWFIRLTQPLSPQQLAEQIYGYEITKQGEKEKAICKRLAMPYDGKEARPLKGLTLDDFFLDDLQSEQFQSPEIYVITSQPLRRYRIKPFPITFFSWASPGALHAWKNYFAQNKERFLNHLGIQEQYDEHHARVTGADIPF